MSLPDRNPSINILTMLLFPTPLCPVKDTIIPFPSIMRNLPTYSFLSTNNCSIHKLFCANLAYLFGIYNKYINVSHIVMHN